MPRTREQFHEMKDERVESILNSALPLFSLYGEKVSIDAICEKAKCSHGIIYHYFKNSKEIYDKLLNTPTYLELLKKLLGPHEGSSYEKIREIISILLNVSIAKMEKICYLNIILKNEDKKSLFSYLCQIIKDGQRANSIIGGEPENIVRSIYFLFKGIYLSFLTEKHPNVKVPSLETVMQFIRKPISF